VEVARGLDRAHIDKAEDELPESERDTYRRYFTYAACDACGGLRLNPRALSVAALATP